MVQCPTCGEQTLVPLHDIFDPAPEPFIPSAEPHPELPDTKDDFAEASIPRQETDSPERESEPLERRAEDEQVDVEEQPVDEGDDDGPALRLRKQNRTDDEMDLTPMVDVTFQLLIFFMVTASFALQKSIEVPTPDQEKKGAAQQLQILDDIEATSIQVQIDANNSILIDDDAVPDPTRLTDMLRDKMRKEQKTELMITASAAALHRSVIAVIDAANEVGMQKIRMVSRQGKVE